MCTKNSCVSGTVSEPIRSWLISSQRASLSNDDPEELVEQPYARTAMPTFQHSELLPEHEILQYKIPAATEEANQCSHPQEKQAEHGMGLCHINDWKYCCKLLILRSARVLARDRVSNTLRKNDCRE